MKIYRVKRLSSNQPITACKLKDSIWEQANLNTDFGFHWEDEIAPQTSFRALYDTDKFYFRFDVEDAKVLTYIVEDDKMEVVNSDRVEIFFRQNEELNPYYCLEMDARGRVLDYVTRYYRDFDYQWSWPGVDNLHVTASENKGGYVVEGAIRLSSLEELGLLKDNKLEAGLYRGYCMKLPDPQADLRWISWVEPDSKKPDFHIPSSFGILRFEDCEKP
ncbi:endoxylanase [Ancylomarina salipaludis]|uniref:Endoxylanase n=1 Tax=Ancylomarina salipaludis TaxID=2501299 RepID=A0A4Q1JPX9_9BACT|nr:sugar-binding protein [Ancylomarina salipaludis]RXQ97464.1 endoxylanase [Ancylomarina salipaludis]